MPFKITDCCELTNLGTIPNNKNKYYLCNSKTQYFIKYKENCYAICLLCFFAIQNNPLITKISKKEYVSIKKSKILL